MATSFPDATTTGVPSGITLQSSGSLVITTPGAVIENLDIHGTVTIAAPDVTLKNCSISSGAYDVVMINKGITGAVVQNCNIDGQSAGGQGIAGQGTFIANNIQNCADGIDVRGDNTVIQDNFIHNMNGTSGSHLDGIQADGGFSNLTIEHNTVMNEHAQTSALMLDNYWGPINNVTINNNILSGGDYSVYIDEVANGQPGGGPVTNVSFTNNHLGNGTYGTLDLRTELGDQPTISGNTNDAASLYQSLHLTGQPTADTSLATSTSTGTTLGTSTGTSSGTSTDTGTHTTTGTSSGTSTGTSSGTSTDTGTHTTTGTSSGTSTSSNTGTGTSTDSSTSTLTSSDHHHSYHHHHHSYTSGTTLSSATTSTATTASVAATPTDTTHSGSVSTADPASTSTSTTGSQATAGTAQTGTAAATTSGSTSSGTAAHDTFVFASHFGHASAPSLQPAATQAGATQSHQTALDQFASDLTHAAQSGHGMHTTSSSSHTGTSTDTTHTANQHHDFHFA